MVFLIIYAAKFVKFEHKYKLVSDYCLKKHFSIAFRNRKLTKQDVRWPRGPVTCRRQLGFCLENFEHTLINDSFKLDYP